VKVVEKMADHSPFAVPAELQVCLTKEYTVQTSGRKEALLSMFLRQLAGSKLSSPM
jgi:hypothetical protein